MEGSQIFLKLFSLVEDGKRAPQGLLVSSETSAQNYEKWAKAQKSPNFGWPYLPSKLDESMRRVVEDARKGQE